jgi:hypothetical protein
MLKYRWLFATGAIIVLAVIGMGIFTYRSLNNQPTSSTENTLLVSEYPVVEIPLQGPAAKNNAEFSGLSWYKDYLILLPQYPNRFSRDHNGVLFAIHKDSIYASLKDPNSNPLEPIQIPFISAGIENIVDGFQGFEAIEFIGDKAYLAIEAGRGQDMMGYLVTGTISPLLDRIRIEPTSLTQNTPQIKMENKSDETLLVANNRVISIFEVNSMQINTNPHATQFSDNLDPLNEIRFPNINYRVTDASQPDMDGFFWIINYQYNGDTELLTESDPLKIRFGVGPTHAANRSVERLIELEYTSDSIKLTERPPIQLELLGDQSARNWEGLVRLDNIGFLIITDKFPRTILGFVSYQLP